MYIFNFAADYVNKCDMIRGSVYTRCASPCHSSCRDIQVDICLCFIMCLFCWFYLVFFLVSKSHQHCQGHMTTLNGARWSSGNTSDCRSRGTGLT